MNEQCFTLAIGKDMAISKGKKYILTIPNDKLSEEEKKIVMQFAMALYNPNIESELVLDPKTKNLTLIGGLYYALKFAIAGKGGRFKDFLKPID